MRLGVRVDFPQPREEAGFIAQLRAAVMIGMTALPIGRITVRGRNSRMRCASVMRAASVFSSRASENEDFHGATLSGFRRPLLILPT